MSDQSTFFVAVTGAQGVGKSTFCRRLQMRLQAEGRREVSLLDGLGDRIKALGIPLGSTSTTQTIAAVFTAHLEREAAAPKGIVILDRCVVDAIAYTRSLGINSDVELRLYERVTALAATRLNLVVHLTCSPFFARRGADHETPVLRADVAERIVAILSELGVPRIDLDASSEDAVELAAAFIWERLV